VITADSNGALLGALFCGLSGERASAAKLNRTATKKTRAARVPSSRNSSRLERLAGISLFLVVTSCWVVGLATWEQCWIDWSSFAFAISAVLSALSVVLTGYLGRIVDAAWVGWIPGAAMMAAGFAMTRGVVTKPGVG
jgi:hypothetical protein